MEIKIKLSCDNWLDVEKMVRKAVALSDEFRESRPDVVINVEAEVKQF